MLLNELVEPMTDVRIDLWEDTLDGSERIGIFEVDYGELPDDAEQYGDYQVNMLYPTNEGQDGVRLVICIEQ